MRSPSQTTLSRVTLCLSRIGVAGGEWRVNDPFCDIWGWDSLRQARLIIELQKEFQISFSVVEMESIISLESGAQVIESHLGGLNL